MAINSISPDNKTPSIPKAKRKRFIKANVTIHDRSQIEAVFDYYLNHSNRTKTKESPKLRYRVEAFLFFPKQFGLNPVTYPKNQFYNDLRPLIRFREPKLGFKRMRGLKVGADSPLTFLRGYLKDLERGTVKPSEHLQAISETRLFACCFISSVLKAVDRWRRFFNQNDMPMDQISTEQVREKFGQLYRLITKMMATIEDFRQLRSQMNLMDSLIHPDVLLECRLADEYCHYRLLDSLAQVVLMTSPYRNIRGFDTINTFFSSLQHSFATLETYGAREHFLRFNKDKDARFREIFIKRRGELKRRMWSVLFLDLRSVPIFTFQQHFGPMIAAGLAALWAAVVQVLLVREAIFRERVNDLLGISGMMFLVLAVLAYIVKDRIKEVGRSYFRAGFFRRLPDHSERIYYDAPLAGRKEIGSLSEMAKFEKYEALPKNVASIRAKHASPESLETDAKQGVLRYTKDVILSANLSVLGRYPLMVVHDILRLNIDACLPRLDEASRQLHAVDKDLLVHTLECPKVYYFDIVLSHTISDRKKNVIEDHVDYFRLVINKSGLVRIDRLNSLDERLLEKS